MHGKGDKRWDYWFIVVFWYAHMDMQVVDETDWNVLESHQARRSVQQPPLPLWSPVRLILASSIIHSLSRYVILDVGRDTDSKINPSCRVRFASLLLWRSVVHIWRAFFLPSAT
jgi:hypothetical protein